MPFNSTHRIEGHCGGGLCRRRLRANTRRAPTAVARINRRAVHRREKRLAECPPASKGADGHRTRPLRALHIKVGVSVGVDACKDELSQLLSKMTADEGKGCVFAGVGEQPWV